MIGLQFIQIFRYAKWTKIDVNMGICLGNSHGNFQLHTFTTSENIAKSFKGSYFFESHSMYPDCDMQYNTVTERKKRK